MDDSNLYYKQQTYLNTCSDADDSTSFPSFPWFPENNRRRKSRLGTHRNQIRRVFQDPTSNDGDHSSSNKENIYDRFSSETSPSDRVQIDSQTEELKPTSSIFNSNQETSSFSFTMGNLKNQKSPVLSIPRVFEDGMSPVLKSFEQSKNMASPFPSCLSEHEIDGILKEINSSDKVGTALFSLSPSSNRIRASILKLEKSATAQVSQPVITNQFQRTETKLNKSFSGELPNDVSSLSAVEDLGSVLKNSTEQTNNLLYRPVAEYVGLEGINSTELSSNSPVLSSDSKNSIEQSNNPSSKLVIENRDSDCLNSIELPNDVSLSSGPKNTTELSTNVSPEPIIENGILDYTNSVELPNNSSIPIKNDFSESIHLELPVDLSSMQDQENVDSQHLNEINSSKFPIDLSSVLDQENILDFQNSKESSSNLSSREIVENIEVDRDKLSSKELKTESMSISSVVDIASTVKLFRAPIAVSDGDKITGSVMSDSNLEQKKSPDRHPEVPPPNTSAVMPPSEAPKPAVRFVEPAVTREFAVPRNSTKIPAIIIVKNKSYKVLNILGTGGSSIVYQVSHPETNELLAVKKVDLPDQDDDITEGYLNEVQMLENLQNCDVIIRIFDHQLVYKNGKKTLYVVMEKGDTDLSSLIKSVNESKKLSIPMIIYYWTEMLAAVNEVHRQGIIHSDLKPANFVLVRGRLKLIDFGIASSIQGDMTSVYKDSFCGTLNYMSPEATSYVRCPSGMTGFKITFKTDVWSLGCILYNLVYGRLPFHHIKKRMEKIYAIVSPSVNVEFPEKKDVPPVLISLLKSCLEKDYKRRPTVQELLDRTMRIFQCSSVD